jgi:hypothetical protein
VRRTCGEKGYEEHVGDEGLGVVAQPPFFFFLFPLESFWIKSTYCLDLRARAHHVISLYKAYCTLTRTQIEMNEYTATVLTHIVLCTARLEAPGRLS